MKYLYSSETHNTTDPSILVPIINNLFSPKSVIDIGCGTGNFLEAFKQIGAAKVFGIDGDTQSQEIRSHYIDENEFQNYDLTKTFYPQSKYDIAICLEVGEHLNKSAADNLVSSLINSSKVVVFSAAIPLQGGQFHINEQWPEYWEKKFASHNYFPADIIRPIIWNNTKISYWYKQNIIVYISELSEYSKIYRTGNNSLLNLVHPDNYLIQVSYLQKLLSGKGNLYFYFYLLFKYFKNLLIK